MRLSVKNLFGNRMRLNIFLKVSFESPCKSCLLLNQNVLHHDIYLLRRPNCWINHVKVRFDSKTQANSSNDGDLYVLMAWYYIYESKRIKSPVGICTAIGITTSGTAEMRCHTSYASMLVIVNNKPFTPVRVQNCFMLTNICCCVVEPNGNCVPERPLEMVISTVPLNWHQR